MNFATLQAIADAVLFEGYILYPYRPSSLKNRQRWNFGTLYPRTYAEAQRPPERWKFHTELLVEGDEETRLSVHPRFLQLVGPSAHEADAWQEGFARTRAVDDVCVGALLATREYHFDLSKLNDDERTIAPPVFVPKAREGRLSLLVNPVCRGLYRVHATFSNESAAPDNAARRAVEDIAFISAHLMLGVDNGSFVSLLESGTAYQQEAAACAQDGVFPVLAGATGDKSHMLCSPIILYDYPQVAAESAGDFFDSTEMDEMLALRVLTLTDEEKEEMRRSDPHARAILERTETLPDEQLARVHGAVRGMRVTTRQPRSLAGARSVDLIEQPFDPISDRPRLESVRVFGVELRTGDRVRLWPQKKADIIDLAMEGKIALIEAIEQDFDDNVQFAVVLEDDPGRDLGLLRQAGHRFFFSPEEIEPMGLEA